MGYNNVFGSKAISKRDIVGKGAKKFYEIVKL